MASATVNHQLSSRDVVAVAVDCGRQLLVMVSKFGSPLRAVDSYEPEAARTETSLTIPMVRLAAVYRSHRSGTKAADHRNPSSFRRQMLCRHATYWCCSWESLWKRESLR